MNVLMTYMQSRGNGNMGQGVILEMRVHNTSVARNVEVSGPT